MLCLVAGSTRRVEMAEQVTTDKVGRKLEQLVRLRFPEEFFAGDFARAVKTRITRREIFTLWNAHIQEIQSLQVPPRLQFYVHIPFCASKCSYCQFDSVVPKDHEQVENFVRHIEKEALLFFDLLGQVPFINASIGGGTPSILNPSQMQNLCEAFFGKLVSRESVRYFSVEVNPDSVRKEHLDVLCNFGLTRVSVGVQSLERQVLECVCRGHQTKEHIIRATTIVRDFPSLHLNFDLIAPLPLETEVSLLEGLKFLFSLQPDSITLYLYQEKQGCPQSDFVSYEHASEILEHQARLHNYIYFRSRVSSFAVRYVPEWQDIRYEQHTVMPSSTMGFGPFSESHIFGHAIYKCVWNRRRLFSYLGLPVRSGFEARAFLAKSAAEQVPVDIADFMTLFGISPSEVAGEELCYLERGGKAVIINNTITWRFDDHKDAGLHAGLFHDFDFLRKLYVTPRRDSLP
jgi:coproporphyrinogen III oxidase-like Fe-S oxidoreductase